jgi:hypothetical protein
VAKETDEEVWWDARQVCGNDDRAMVIEGARVEQVHKAHKAAVASRHDRHEEA